MLQSPTENTSMSSEDLVKGSGECIITPTASAWTVTTGRTSTSTLTSTATSGVKFDISQTTSFIDDARFEKLDAKLDTFRDSTL